MDTVLGSNTNKHTLTPEQLLAERGALQSRIQHLESELATIEAGKLAAERMLRMERAQALALAQNGTLAVQRDWIALANELKIAKGATLGENNLADDNAYAESRVIDFTNQLRMGALAELTECDDDTLIVKTKAYEIFYKAAKATLENRSLRIKIERSVEFEETKKNIREREKAAKLAKETEKFDKRRRTPEEKMLETLMGMGMSESEALAHIERTQNAAKQMLAEAKK